MTNNIIVFEGLDGAGKSTQKDLLKAHFDSLGISYKDIHFPKLNEGYHGTLISEFLRGEFGSIDDVHPKLVALLFAADRKEHLHQMQEWLDQGHWIIMDRYVYSNIAFQCAKLTGENEKDALKEWILNYEYQYNGLPRSYQSFFLDVPINFIEESLSQERQGEDRHYLNGEQDIHESSMALQKNVRQEYLKLVEEQEDFHLINCADGNGHFLPAEEVHAKVSEHIADITKKKDA